MTRGPQGGPSQGCSAGAAAHPHCPHTACNCSVLRYSEAKPLLKELDRLIDAALERILQPSLGNSSESISPPLDLELWYQIPLVLIDEHDKDNPIILDIFETNQTAAGIQSSTDTPTPEGNESSVGSTASAGNESFVGNHTATAPTPTNTTLEEKKYKLAVKLVRWVPRRQPGAGVRDGQHWVPRQGCAMGIGVSSPRLRMAEGF